MREMISTQYIRRGVAVLLLGAAAAWAQTGPAGVGSLTDFQLAGGFDADGYKTWDILGQKAETSASDNTQVAISHMRLQMYSGGAAIAIESTVSSDAATVDTAKGVVRGQQKLYVQGANGGYSVTGNNWTWDEKKKIIQLGSSVYVSFNSTTTSANGSETPAQVKILSDTLVIDQSDASINKFDFTGNVTVTDHSTATGTPTNTTCQELIVLAKRSATANPSMAVKNVGAPASLSVGRGGVEHLTAMGNVVVTQGDWEATGQQAEMFPDEQRVVMSGAPKMKNASRGLTLDGGFITWLRDKQEIQVQPVVDASNTPGRVRVAMPALASNEPQGAPGQLIITGQSLNGKFGDNAQRFDVEKSVHVDDPSLTVDADHLDAEFAPSATAPIGKSAAGTDIAPQMDKLNHLTATGNVTIQQESLATTTPQAEILPIENEILLSGGPHVVDSQSAAVMDGDKITIARDGQSAEVTGSTAHPAVLQLPALGGVNGTQANNAETKITSDRVVMSRQAAQADKDAFTQFTFDGNAHVTGNDLDMTCAALDVFTNNVPAQPGEDPLLAAAQVNKIQELIARGQVDVIQTVSAQADGSQSAYEAQGARAVIHPKTHVSDEAAADQTKTMDKEYRLVELFGDPAGVAGPLRPTVEVPLLEGLGGGADTGNQTNGPVAPTKTIITSDQQQLLTSPTGNTYFFSGNVRINGGALQATCDEMRAEVAPGSTTLKDIIAAGNVIITQDTTKATAGRAEIVPGDQPVVTLSDNAQVVDKTKGEDVSNADIIIHFDPHTHTHTTTLEQSSNPTGVKSSLRPSITFPVTAKPFDNALNLGNKPSAGTSR
jgi:lipopolysaccharide export system protein LptA